MIVSQPLRILAVERDDVVLDVMMPGMDGFETLEEIRKENSLPILMFTSKNDSASKVRGLRAGADDYLTKPFDMDELIARIASLIRRYFELSSHQQRCFSDTALWSERRNTASGAVGVSLDIPVL